jgi:ribosomal protein L24
MVKTEIRKGDRVRVFRGAARLLKDEKGQPLVGTVLSVDRSTGRAQVELPHPKPKGGAQETPLPGVETWKSVRYNAKRGEAGGFKIVKRGVHVSNLKVVEKGKPRQFGGGG